MGYGIKDRVFVQLSINGVEVPLKDNVIDFIHIVESARIFLPMLTFKILDATKFLTKENLLVDGALIQLTTEVLNDRETYMFRLFSSREQIIGGLTFYIVRGYLDAYRYWTMSMNTPLLTSASGVIRRCASMGGLEYDGPETADRMSWMPNNRRLCVLAAETAQRAYIGPKSCFQICVSTDKRLIARDISTLPESVESYSNKEVSENTNIITDFGILNRGGFYNVNTGYKDFRFTQTLLNTTPPSGIRDVQVEKNSVKLMLNQEIRGIAQNRVLYAPISTGSVHSNYEKAFYQNIRLANLFNFGIEIVTPIRPKVRLFESFTAEVSKPGVDSVEQYNGKFLLTSKVFYYTGANAFFKIEGFRHGLNIGESTQV